MMVHGMRGVGGVCEICMCLAWGGIGGEGVNRWEDWVLPLLWVQGGVLDVCLGWGGEWVGVLDQGLDGRAVLCLCELWVILCVDSRSRYLYIVLVGHLYILWTHSVQSCCTLWISASYHVQIIEPPGLFVVVGPWFVLDITCFYEEQRQPSSGSAGRIVKKMVNWTPIAGGGSFRHNLHSSSWQLHRPVCCVVWSIFIIFVTGILFIANISPNSEL